MLFSKSFDYAIRGVLYISISNKTKKRIPVEVIAAELSVPRHFMGKIMNKLARKGILDATKGPFGGLSVNNDTPDTTLLTLLKTVDGMHQLNTCVLKLKKCNESRPCVLHDLIAPMRDEIFEVMSNTTVNDLVNGNKPDLLSRLSYY